MSLGHYCALIIGSLTILCVPRIAMSKLGRVRTAAQITGTAVFNGVVTVPFKRSLTREKKPKKNSTFDGESGSGVAKMNEYFATE